MCIRKRMWGGCVSENEGLNFRSRQREEARSRQAKLGRAEGDKAGSYLRLKDSGSTQRKAQRPSKTCNEIKAEK